MSADPLADLAAIVAAAAAAGTIDRDELRHVCLAVLHGGERMKERLGCLVASATINALESSNRPARDPLAVAQAAFTPFRRTRRDEPGGSANLSDKGHRDRRAGKLSRRQIG